MIHKSKDSKEISAFDGKQHFSEGAIEVKRQVVLWNFEFRQIGPIVHHPLAAATVVLRFSFSFFLDELFMPFDKS